MVRPSLLGQRIYGDTIQRLVRLAQAHFAC